MTVGDNTGGGAGTEDVGRMDTARQGGTNAGAGAGKDDAKWFEGPRRRQDIRCPPGLAVQALS